MDNSYDTDLKYRAIRDDDVLFGHGEDDFLHGIDAMAQVLRTRLRALEDEWWEGDDTALPYYTEILGGPATEASQDAIDLMVIDRIMDTVGVLAVSDVTSSIEDRHYSFSCRVQTIYGETEAEVEI